MVFTPARAAGTARPIGMRVVIGYKMAKAVLMVVVASWLTATPSGAYQAVERLARDLAEAGAASAHVGAWLEQHLSLRIVKHAMWLAWGDALTTAAEAALLLQRKPWGEWIVTAGLGLLLPIELVALARRPSAAKVVALVGNGAVVAYLLRRRMPPVRDWAPLSSQRHR